MLPTHASCSKCNASIKLFTEVLPDNCPACQSPLKYTEFDKCQGCSARVAKGLKNCVSCRMSRDPSNPGQAPSGNSS